MLREVVEGVICLMQKTNISTKSLVFCAAMWHRPTPVQMPFTTSYKALKRLGRMGYKREYPLSLREDVYDQLTLKTF